MLAEVAALDSLVDMRRSRFATLGKSVSAATAGKLGKDRRLGDQVRQVLLLEDFICLATSDVVEALKAHYERQREDAMHLISVMDK